MSVIGITGTNGKTTTTYIIEAIFHAAKKKSGVIGTINYRYGEKKKEAPQTTPESLDLQKMFREMVENTIQYCILEVSSHALALNRVDKTDFAVGIFTNLTQDHLDFHHNKSEYFETKKKLFREYNLKKAVINIDDPYGQLLSTTIPMETFSVSMHGKGDILGRNVTISTAGTRFIAKTPEGEVEIISSLIGYHNVYNILCAMGAAIACNISLSEIKKGIASLNVVPGRFQRLEEDQDFTIVIDYAHTDDALKNVLKAAKELTDKRIITVFGCGGNRDNDKRPKMGEVAGRYGDYTIITSDNPRNEDPASIASDIEAGIRRVADKRKYCLILNRKEAIEHAINMAAKGDMVVIAGKGHENYQLFQGSRIHFDDYETAREFVKRRIGGQHSTFSNPINV